MKKSKNNVEIPNSSKNKLHLFGVIFWFKKLFQNKKNIPLGLVIKSEKGPMNEPIIFNSITEGMEYFKTHP